jgi:hypothetical protein
MTLEQLKKIAESNPTQLVTLHRKKSNPKTERVIWDTIQVIAQVAYNNLRKPYEQKLSGWKKIFLERDGSYNTPETDFTFNKNVDLRFDGYYYQPFVQLIRNDDGTPSYSKPFKGDLFIASSSLIYHSIIGPISATVNYFPKQTAPIAFQISYGWVLFNERAIR